MFGVYLNSNVYFHVSIIAFVYFSMKVWEFQIDNLLRLFYNSRIDYNYDEGFSTNGSTQHIMDFY